MIIAIRDNTLPSISVVNIYDIFIFAFNFSFC